ncbi:EAL domain-containing protein [Vibrio paucivorans]|uniref:EAL domain-containing protein n=1 Tax=Vibrio paucivorans TaxID=2829489 RepID=A0A9X3HRK2_9VIBR|nr:EAL domain-containing protein [Vibrio paucivorans]MCW8334001.1 EAL domain-containing protein [Vibrio paucivorans]
MQGHRFSSQSGGIAQTKRPCVEWKWNIKDSSFELSQEQCEQVFASKLPPMTTNFLMACLSFEDQEQLLAEFAKATRIPKTYSCCIHLDKGKIYFSCFTFQVVERHVISGTLLPLLSFPTSGTIYGTLFKQVFDNPLHGIIVIDSEQNILLCNHYFEKHCRYSNLDLIGRPFRYLDSGKHSDNFYQVMWQQVHELGKWSGTVLIKTGQGHIVPQDLSLQKVTAQERVFYIGYFVDLSNHLYRVADMELGGVELLTHLPTEQQFTQRLAQKWMNSDESSIYLVLAFVPEIPKPEEYELRQSLSEHLSNNEYCHLSGYLGNNYFVVSLECEKRTGPSQVRVIQQAIRTFFSTLNHRAGSKLHDALFKGKVGVSILGHDTNNPRLLVPHAVQAMLEQTGDMKGMITFYNGSIHREAMRRKELEDVAITAIRNEDVEVFYQPIVDTRNWDIAKFEALCRFRDGEGQIMNTQEMVAIAEDLDLVSELDWCVGKKSLQGLEKIHQRFGNTIGITINRSLNTKLGADAVLKSAEDMIRVHASTPDLVTIELTESAYFDSESAQSSLIKNIRMHGVSVAIDDFGTGYSSFTYLSDCNFDLLKIDREFVTDIKVGTHKYHIVRMITDLSHTLDVKVVAEGVETRQELEVLCGIGVDYIQGYFFSKPLPMDCLEQAWGYQERLADFLQRKSSLAGIGILRIAKSYTPTLEPGDTLERARNLLIEPSLRLEHIPILNGEKCIGLVDKECINLQISPTVGTEFETSKDLAAKKRTLNQIMKTDIETLSFHARVGDLPSLLNQKGSPPWIVVDDLGNYLGVVTQQDVLDHFSHH